MSGPLPHIDIERNRRYCSAVRAALEKHSTIDAVLGELIRERAGHFPNGRPSPADFRAGIEALITNHPPHLSEHVELLSAAFTRFCRQEIRQTVKPRARPEVRAKVAVAVETPLPPGVAVAEPSDHDASALVAMYEAERDQARVEAALAHERLAETVARGAALTKQYEVAKAEVDDLRAELRGVASELVKLRKLETRAAVRLSPSEQVDAAVRLLMSKGYTLRGP